MDATVLTDNDTAADAGDAQRAPQRDEMRDAIIAHAKDLFAHYGYSKTNIGDIAAACGTSPGNLYRYFKNKQAIGHAVVKCFFDEEAQKLIPIIADTALSAEMRLRKMVTTSVMHTVDQLRQSAKIVELAEMICETEEGVALVGGHVAHRHEQLAAIIADGIASGEFRAADVGRAARAVQMGTKFFVVPFAIARHGIDQVEDDLTLTLDLLCAGLKVCSGSHR